MRGLILHSRIESKVCFSKHHFQCWLEECSFRPRPGPVRGNSATSPSKFVNYLRRARTTRQPPRVARNHGRRDMNVSSQEKPDSCGDFCAIPTQTPLAKP